MRNKRGRVSIKVTLMLGALMLLIGGNITGSLAWFVDSTSQVKNTFTVGNININTAAEQAAPAAMLLADDGDLTANSATPAVPLLIPGHTLELIDTTVTISKGSESCYLFAEIVEDFGALPKTVTDEETGETRNVEFKEYIAYEVEDGWTAGDGIDEADGGSGVPEGVYYRIVMKDDVSDQAFKIVRDNKVTISKDITSEMLEVIQEKQNYPALLFSSGAVQYYSTDSQNFTPGQAWSVLKAQSDAQG